MSISVTDFNRMFSIPREPQVSLSPGQFFEKEIPKGKKVTITDVYIENLGPGTSTIQILEQTDTNSFEIRYAFHTAPNQVTIINFTTGLKLGDLADIKGTIRIQNPSTSEAKIFPRVNGILVG